MGWGSKYKVRNADINQKAKRDIPKLRKFANKILKLAEEIKSKDIGFNHDDNFAFMSLLFFRKQVTHMKSILALKESRDVILIARSMLDGLCQLLWVNKNPKDRAYRWRTFKAVLDWRMMQQIIQAGKKVSPTYRKDIEKGLQDYGEQFYTKEAKRRKREGEKLPKDPYFKNWTGRSIRQIWECIGAKELYLRLYKPFSEWHHWSPSGLRDAIAIIPDEQRFIYSSIYYPYIAASLNIGFNCLLRNIELINEYFKLDMRSKIKKLKGEYIEWKDQVREFNLDVE